MSKTLLQLRAEVRQRADMQSTQFVTDAELTTSINGSYGELYDLLVSKFEDYYTKSSSATLTGSQNQIPLPIDFYKLRGLDAAGSSGSDWCTVPRYAFSERNSYGQVGSRILSGQSQLSYNVLGGVINLLPETQATGTYRVWYVPRFVPLVIDADVMGDVLDFSEYVVIDAAIKCLVKEESDISAMMGAKAMLIGRVNTMAAQRDATGMGRVGDVNSSSYGDGFFPY